MDNKAIVNGKEIILSQAETEAAANFHKNRLPFAWVKGDLVFNTNEGDTRDHQHWLLEDYGVSIEEWELSNRGYIMDNKIQLFIGSGFEPLDFDEVTESDLRKLVAMHNKIFNRQTVKVYNGVKVGKIGEIWEPLIDLGEFSLTKLK